MDDYDKLIKLKEWERMYYDRRKLFKCDIYAVERDIKILSKQFKLPVISHKQQINPYNNSIYDVLKKINL